MTSVTDDLPLAADFPKATVADWRKLVDGVLKGAPFEKLVGKTYDGLKIEPLYPRAKGVAPVAGRAAAAPWQIMQRIDHPDAAAANAQALQDLENGATGLALVFAGGNGATASGWNRRPMPVAKVVEGRFISMPASAIELQLGAGNRGWPAIHVRGICEEQRLDPAGCDIRFGLDPLAACAVCGATPL